MLQWNTGLTTNAEISIGCQGVELIQKIFLHPIVVCISTASLTPKWVSVRVARKGALNIDMGRYGDSNNGFV